MSKSVGLVTIGLVAAALAGCGSGKLTAQQAAGKLAGIVAPGSRVRCVAATDGSDYRCRVQPPHGAVFTTEITVNGQRITDVGG